jgi:hypothetical protein
MARLSALLVAAVAMGCGGKSSSKSPGSPTEPSGPDPTPQCTAPVVATPIHQSEGGVVGGLALMGGRALMTDGALLSVPLAGGSSTTLVDHLGIGEGLVATTNTVFFTQDNALYSVAIAGGSTTLVRGSFTINSAAADATSVYLPDTIGKVLKFTPPDVTPTELAIGDKLTVRDLAVNTSDVFVAFQDLSDVSRITGGILKIAKGGGPPSVIVPTAGLPEVIVVDDSTVFWVEDPPVGTFGNGHIARADINGSNVMTLVNQGASSLAVDASHLYMLLDTLSRVPKSGGAPEILSSGYAGAGLLRIEGSDAVWIDHYSKAMSDPTRAMVWAMCLQRPNVP